MKQNVSILEARLCLGPAAEGVNDSDIASLMDTLYDIARLAVREVRNKKGRHILPSQQPGSDTGNQP